MEILGKAIEKKIAIWGDFPPIFTKTLTKFEQKTFSDQKKVT